MSQYWKHKIKVIFGIGILLGILLLIVQGVCDIPYPVMMRGYIIGSIIVILLTGIINAVWQFKFQKKLMGMNSMLYQEETLDLFIEQIDTLLKKIKSDFNRNQLLISLSVAYCEKQQYQEAKDVLLQMEEKALSGIIKAIYYHNLAYYHFLLNESKMAIQIMEEHKTDFEKWRKNKALEPNLLINEVYLYINQENWNEAKERLVKLEDIKRDALLERSFQLAKSKLESIAG
ncbi:hypothetical protein [Sinanaerobacter sp. ZZT-01]|uniref:hypothetical protein n=1 Tax=Sinanaerobacter sp. ZZT-01 TaxID=3111540 RepID=UPI002D77D46F|nr:hypothetical protein [Sinanaerobacter sp. ZZT-01]WRR93526.1 hypothetical protein U5921_16075 [Sinanaerobacter sp. ZZT-01]